HLRRVEGEDRRRAAIEIVELQARIAPGRDVSRQAINLAQAHAEPGEPRLQAVILARGFQRLRHAPLSSMADPLGYHGRGVTEGGRKGAEGPGNGGCGTVVEPFGAV